MTTGLTIEKMGMEIRSIIIELPDVDAAFGFGSFFRNQPFHDVDVLVVLKPGCCSNLRVYYELQGCFRELGLRFEVCIDFTVLTSREFSERPLIDMDSLIRLSP
jgi:hypothetical protein